MCTRKPGSLLNLNESDLESGWDHLDKQSDSSGLNLVYALASYVTLGKSFNISTSVSLSENWGNTNINL